MLSAYIDGLSDIDPGLVVEACRRWPTLPERGKWWPALEELRGVADDIACEHRVRALPKPAASHTTGGTCDTRKHTAPVIRDPAAMRRIIADLRANPSKYIAAEALAKLGEDMLARWESAQGRAA